MAPHGNETMNHCWDSTEVRNIEIAPRWYYMLLVITTLFTSLAMLLAANFLPLPSIIAHGLGEFGMGLVMLVIIGLIDSLLWVGVLAYVGRFYCY
jgi:uncharacterized membrane protein YqhA